MSQFLIEETMTEVIFCEFCETFKNRFITDHFRKTNSANSKATMFHYAIRENECKFLKIMI